MEQHMTVTCTINDDGTLSIDAVGRSSPDEGHPDPDAHTVAWGILSRVGRRRVRRVQPSPLLPDVTNMLILYQKAAKAIEGAMLSPYTAAGRARLEREFFELVIV